MDHDFKLKAFFIFNNQNIYLVDFNPILNNIRMHKYIYTVNFNISFIILT